MRGSIRLGAAFVLVIVLAFGVTGCQQASDQAAKSAVEAAAGVKVDQSGDGVTVTGPDGTVASTGKSLPADMPSDFPVYAGNVLYSAKSTTDGDTSFSYTMETADSVQAVADWYKAEVVKLGWSIESTFSGGDAGNETSMLIIKKGTMDATLTMGSGEGKTSIMAVLVLR